MILVYGTFTTKPQHRQTMIELARSLVAPSSAEPGCMLYSFLEDTAQPGRFVFFEKWQSRSDLDAHFKKSYFLDFAQQFPQMIEGEGVIEIHEVSHSSTMG